MTDDRGRYVAARRVFPVRSVLSRGLRCRQCPRASRFDRTVTAVKASLRFLEFLSLCLQKRAALVWRQARHVTALRIGKAVELSLDADSEDLAREQVQLLCARLLANPVTENWTMSLEEQKA